MLSDEGTSQGLSGLACLKFTFVPWEVASYSLVASGWEWGGRERVICETYGGQSSSFWEVFKFSYAC